MKPKIKYDYFSLEEAEAESIGHPEIKFIGLNKITGKYFHSYWTPEFYYLIWGNKVTYEVIKSLTKQIAPKRETIAAETKKPSINAFLIPVFRVGITQF